MWITPHEGSNPSLCANSKGVGKFPTPLLLAHGRGFSPGDVCRRVRIRALRVSASRGDESNPKHQAERLFKIYPEQHIPPFTIGARERILTQRRMSQGTAMCRSDTTHYAGYGIRIAVCCILHSEIDKLACQAYSVSIFVFDEYPSHAQPVGLLTKTILRSACKSHTDCL